MMRHIISNECYLHTAFLLQYNRYIRNSQALSRGNTTGIYLLAELARLKTKRNAQENTQIGSRLLYRKFFCL